MDDCPERHRLLVDRFAKVERAPGFLCSRCRRSLRGLLVESSVGRAGGRRDKELFLKRIHYLLTSQSATSIIAAIAALVFLMLLVSCSVEQGEDQATETRSEERSRGVASQTEKGAIHEPSETNTRGSRPQARGYLVPVAHLTSTWENISMKKLSQSQGLAVPQGYRDAAARLLDQPDLGSFGSAATVVDHVSRTPQAIGLVPWQAVNPKVKALAVDGEALLAADGAVPEGYPLAPEDSEAPEPEKLRRVVVGGDIVLDRGQSYTVIQQGMGLDFPLDGGYAAIIRRIREPNPYSAADFIHQFTAERQGGSGAVREYLVSADLTLANLESPVVSNAVWHPDATTFTGEPQLLPILNQAGIDGVTLANNHILDAGVEGIQETQQYLEDAGISYAGAGMDLASAREPMIFDLGGVKLGVLSYLDVPSYEWAWATENAPGTAPLLEDVMREDIERLKSEVDLVLVMPHWGKEYIAEPEPYQVEMARAAVDAGADLFVGGHAHWPKGIEVYEQKPIFYGVGNFLLDQSWSEETSTGIFAEITLYGDRPVQAKPVPFVMLDQAQPNFLLPEAGGNRALRKIYSASRGPEFEAYKGRPGVP